MSKVNLAIIGGGLVGASLALALQAGARERGWSIVLIEPFAPGNAYQPSYDARSSALSYGSRQIYERLGLWPAIAERAEPILHIHVSDRGRFGATRLTAIEEGVPALGYVVENAWLGQCLWKALDPEVVRWHCPAEVKTLEAREGGYRLTLDDETQLDCELAILADGGRSGLREQLGIAVEQTPYRQTALIANVSPSEAHLGQAFERFTPSGPMALLPLPENRCALIWTRPGKDAERLRGLDDAAFLGELQAAFGYRLGAFRQVGARHCYPLHLVEAREQVRPHLVVLGNAAHSLHPIAGQGFNLSLRDTLALVDALLHDDAPLGEFAALQRYLDGSGVDYRLEARSMEDIRQGVDFILQKFGYRQILSSNADKPGWVRLNGELAEQDERWARIDALLESEVPGLLGVENQVRVAGSHLRRLERLLADAGLDRQLSFRERGERIELSGTLDEVQLSAFYRLQREFQQEFGNRPSLELLSRGKRASGDELEFTVRSVSLGRVPYVVLGDGQKYPVGASTSRGVRILAIEPESILVARGKQRFIINLKGEVLHDDSLGNATVGR
ncbi:2-octaprenyl-6-methoxyphenyl hydroxylase [Pseudomonas aeruginosa]|nr:2-octaprenyl-6-methoxyphenyl hydroxylase [Pseudomonas aeruginosa]